MDKKDLLKKIGFSKEYLDAFDDFNRTGIGEIKVIKGVVNEPLRCNTSDTSELSIKKTMLHSSTSLSIKQ